MKVGKIVLGNKQGQREALTPYFHNERGGPTGDYYEDHHVSLPPEVSRVVLVDLRPDDVVVLECDHSLSMEAAAQIKAYAQTIWPKNQVAVLVNGMTLRVVRPQEDTP